MAGLVAGVVSGAPSTVHAVATGRSSLAAVEAAGTLLVPASAPPARLVAAAVVVHGGLSVGWATLLAALLPRRHSVAWGAAAGLGIAAFDLGLVGRHVPAIRALPQLPQWADHVAFGAVVGSVVGRMARSTTCPQPEI
jgi:hypothetical protein